ncbi:MAG: PQQ-binding-like beta-propeller repeat protein, partial [Chthoniobacteraceae bacterium]
MKSLSRFLLPIAISCLAAIRANADWPTYQHDSSRVGATPETLTAPLVSRWEFASPTPPKMAWPGEEGRSFEGYVMTNRIRFDEAFQVAIAGGRVYFGSSVDGRVHCRNLETGREEWTFFTDGPIRLAPMIVDGRVYVGSDDGHAYCLDAATGKVIWNLRAGPNDERILARGRMISRWPVRTGVLVDGGTAFFGAGVFPHENVYLYAVEAATGKVVWKNDAISQDDAGRNDLSPQGYLLVTKDILFVPSGRALSAAFNRATGEPLSRTTGSWRGIGGTQAMLADDQLYAVGERQILATEQTSGKAGFGWFRGRQMTLAGDMGYFADGSEIVAVDRMKYAEGSRERYKAEASLTALSTFLKKHPALAELKKVTAAEKELTEAKKALAKAGAAEHAAAQAALAKVEKAFADAGKSYEAKRADYQEKKDQLAAKQKAIDAMAVAGVKWKAPVKLDSALILAGKMLIAGGQSEVVCLDAETGKQLWKSAVDGDARGLAAADGHLVVSTSSGKIYAFADASRTALPPVASVPPTTADPFPKDDLSPMYAAAADSILKQT